MNKYLSKLSQCRSKPIRTKISTRKIVKQHHKGQTLCPKKTRVTPQANGLRQVRLRHLHTQRLTNRRIP